MKRDGKRSWFHELDNFGDVVRALPPPRETVKGDRRAEAQAKRERKQQKALREAAAALERAVREGRVKESDIPEALDVVASELPMLRRI
jgi:hypothetical protein